VGSLSRRLRGQEQGYWLNSIARQARDGHRASLTQQEVLKRVKAKPAAETALRERHPLALIAFYASTFMGCQLYIIREKGQIDLHI